MTWADQEDHLEGWYLSRCMLEDQGGSYAKRSSDAETSKKPMWVSSIQHIGGPELQEGDQLTTTSWDFFQL